MHAPQVDTVVRYVGDSRMVIDNKINHKFRTPDLSCFLMSHWQAT